MPAGFTAKSARTMVEGVGTVEFRCHNCGYGISLTGELPRCPMCRPSPGCTLKATEAGTRPRGGQDMATKDKNTKKSMEKKPAQKTLKEKRQAKKAKR